MSFVRWSDIAKTITGRSENAVKNYWNATLRRKEGAQVSWGDCSSGSASTPSPLKLYMTELDTSGGPNSCGAGTRVSTRTQQGVGGGIKSPKKRPR